MKKKNPNAVKLGRLRWKDGKPSIEEMKRLSRKGVLARKRKIHEKAKV